jgi:hypothetical protein
MVNWVQKAAMSKYTNMAENEAINGNMRQELVIAKDNKATIIDITNQFENRIDALKQARLDKLLKYDNLTRTLRSRFSNVIVDAIILGSLGTQERQSYEVYVLEEVPEAIQEAS